MFSAPLSLPHSEGTIHENGVIVRRFSIMIKAGDEMMPTCLSASLSVCLLALICVCFLKCDLGRSMFILISKHVTFLINFFTFVDGFAAISDGHGKDGARGRRRCV